MSKPIKRIATVGRALAVLPALAALVFAMQPSSAEAREYRANLQHYCKQVKKMSSWGFYKKKPYFRCTIVSMGFNTTYVSKTRPISLTDVCRRQHKTKRWRFHGKKVFCIRENFSVLKLCNKTDKPIYTAYGVYEGKGRRGGWTSYGWYKAPARGCRNLNLGREYTGNVYVYAQGGGNKWEGRNASLCIDTHSGFKLTGADRRDCSGNFKRVGMTEFRIRPGSNRYNFR